MVDNDSHAFSTRFVCLFLFFLKNFKNFIRKEGEEKAGVLMH